MKILVVEDDLDTRDLLSELLEIHGHEIATAGESQEALSVLSKQPDIDLLITDVSLPGMSGIELASAAKSLQPQIGILVCSGYGEQQFDSLPFAVEWVQKPIEMESFIAAVEQFPGASA
jgi:CheY-like chemotaxis protein